MSLGGTVPAGPLLDAAGIPEPKAGETLLGNVQVGQPTAVDQPPDAVPMQPSADSSGQQPV